MTRHPSPDDANDPERTDAAFEAIVSSLRNQDPPGTAPWPDAEEVDSPEVTTDEATDAAKGGATGETGPTAADARPSRLGSDWTGWEDVTPESAELPEELDEDEDDGHHFVPPAPPPIPRGDRIIRWAWAGALGAPALLAVFFVFGWTISDLTGLVLLAVFLAGFGTLVTRMRPGRSEDDTDDGAVV